MSELTSWNARVLRWMQESPEWCVYKIKINRHSAQTNIMWTHLFILAAIDLLKALIIIPVEWINQNWGLRMQLLFNKLILFYHHCDVPAALPLHLCFCLMVENIILLEWDLMWPTVKTAELDLNPGFDKLNLFGAVIVGQ